MCAWIKNIGTLKVNKPVKGFGVLLFLLATVFTSAHDHKLQGPTPGSKGPGAIYSGYTSWLFKALSLIVADPPTDITVTGCVGTPLTIQSASVTGFPNNQTWNDGSTGTSLTVNSAGDYWWQVTGTNIVTNGDFTNGTIGNAGSYGFTSSYTYKDPTVSCGIGCNILGAEGTYSVYTDPHQLHSQFDHFGDHTNNTSGPRNMLIVNGASIPNITVWQETIPILPNTNYVFSVWVTSVNPAAPAILQFSINGTNLGTGPFNLSSTLADGTWQYFTTTWNSGTNSGNLPIALVNQNTAANGNDFAVDDIVFAPVFRQNVHVTFNPLPVLILNNLTACGTSALSTVNISGYDPTRYDYTVKNSLGTIVTLTNASSGVYTITKTDRVTGCVSAPKQITIYPVPQQPGISSM